LYRRAAQKGDWLAAMSAACLSPSPQSYAKVRRLSVVASMTAYTTLPATGLVFPLPAVV
jgi:hypothetical protein